MQAWGWWGCGWGCSLTIALPHGPAVCMFSFEMLIPDANILSHLKPLCHFPGGCVTECPEGPLLMMLVPPQQILRGGTWFSPVFCRRENSAEAGARDLVTSCFQATVSPQTLRYLGGQRGSRWCVQKTVDVHYRLTRVLPLLKVGYMCKPGVRWLTGS